MNTIDDKLTEKVQEMSSHFQSPELANKIIYKIIEKTGNFDDLYQRFQRYVNRLNASRRSQRAGVVLSNQILIDELNKEIDLGKFPSFSIVDDLITKYGLDGNDNKHYRPLPTSRG